MVPETIAAAMLAFEQSGLGHAARSTIWLYPLANLVHVLGAALLVGAIATFDLQVLRRQGNLTIVGRATIPLAAFGVVLQLASGIVLLSAEASPSSVAVSSEAMPRSRAAMNSALPRKCVRAGLLLIR